MSNKNDFIIVSKDDIKTLSKVVIRALNKTLTLSDIETLEDTVSPEIFDILASTFREEIEL